MLVDTGATVSLVDKKVFDLAKTGGSLRKVTRQLIAANWESLQVYGETCLNFMLQGHLVKHDVIVCDLPGVEAIMGIDLIEDLGGMLDVANGTLHARTLGATLRLHRAGMSKCSKVTLVDTTVVPPRSEITLAGRKVGGRWDPNEKKLGIVEPTTQLPENGQILDAKALVNAEQECVPLRVANLTSEPVVEEETAEDADIPEHLRGMVEDANESLNEAQRKQVSALVCHWAHLFAKPDGKLGRTPLVEHHIDTGDARSHETAPPTSTTVHYERAKAEYGAHTSMGDQPSTNLCDWINEMRQSPYSFTARAMDDPTRYDVIVQLQERVEVLEERDAQRDGEMDTMRILQRLERRNRLLSDDILAETLEESVAGAARRGVSQSERGGV